MVEDNIDDVSSEIEEIENVSSENGDVAIPGEYDVELDPTDDMRERRYLWIARVFAIFSAVSLCTNIVLLIAISNLLPLNRVEPYYLTFYNKGDQVVKVSESIRNKKIYDVIEESLVREYVQLRHTVVPDPEEMERRWSSGGLLRWISDDGVYRAFNEDYKRMMDRIETQRYSQTVSISTVNLVSNPRDRYWQVNFETTEMIGEARKPITRKWRAIVKIKLKDRKDGIIYSERLKNPLGMEVSNYSVQPDT